MATIVTRLYEDPAHADAVVATLKADGFPESSMDVIEQRSRVSALAQISDAGIPDEIAQQYAQHLTSQRALLVVRAPFVPFGAARRAIEVADTYPAFDAGVVNENKNIPDEPDPKLFLSVLTSHRLFFTNAYETRSGTTPRGFSKAFQIPLLSEKGKRMRPAVFQRPPIFPIRPLSHGRTTKRHIIHRFFGTFIVDHLSDWGPFRPSKMRHGRITN